MITARFQSKHPKTTILCTANGTEKGVFGEELPDTVSNMPKYDITCFIDNRNLFIIGNDRNLGLVHLAKVENGGSYSVT